ncbi:MAG TPA: hypothetical protein VJ400_07935 [Thermoplasmata archaeon]|nr:hypothetical protein [Thermoplasmata archaeon]
MPGFRPTRILVHPDVETAYHRLEDDSKRGRKEAAAIWGSFQHALSQIRLDGQWGEVVPRIPDYFLRRYGVRNLYCVDLAFFHRAFYTIVHRDIVCLDLVDHARYSRWFPGRRR